MKKVEYIIEELKMVLSNTACLNLVPKDKNVVVKFRPGQYGLISFLRGNVLSVERPFSFASSMLDRESLQFGFRVYGQFTSDIAKLKQGDSVFVRGPFGAFIYNEKKYKDTVFLAAGIGITPFLSAIRYASETSLPNKMTLIYSNNFEKEIPFYKELKRLESINENLKSYFLVSQPDEELNKRLFVPGRISESIVYNVLKGNIVGKTFFICGPEPFMVAAVDLLKGLGVEDRNIKMEGFSQIPMSFFEKGTGIFPLIAGTSALLTLAAFITINQIEVTKATIKAQDEQQAYSQQQVIDAPVTQQFAQTQPQDIQQVPSTQDFSTIQDLSTTQAPITPPPSPVVKPKVRQKNTVVTASPKTTPIPTRAPAVYTPPVYVPPKVVTPTPVYVPPVYYTPPPVPAYTYYSPPARTRSS